MACSLFRTFTFALITFCLSTLCAQSVKIPTGSQHTGSSPADTKQSESTVSSLIGSNQTEYADASRSLARKPWSIRHQDSARTITGFKAGIEQCIKWHNLKTDQPIVITSVDYRYNDITKKWAARNKDMGVDQYLLVALDDKVAEMAALLGYPALAPDGKCIPPLAATGARRSLAATGAGRSSPEPGQDPGHLPGLLSASKFIVPALLLGEGFQRVVFSEMDVFFRVNPFEATDMYEGHFLAMASPQDPDIVNIGFMEFRAPGAPNEISSEFVEKLSTLSVTIIERKDVMKVIGADQEVFNKFIRYYKESAGSLFYPTLLNSRSPELFTVFPQADTEITKIAHLTNCVPNPECKIDKLNALYAHRFQR